MATTCLPGAQVSDQAIEQKKRREMGWHARRGTVQGRFQPHKLADAAATPEDETMNPGHAFWIELESLTLT